MRETFGGRDVMTKTGLPYRDTRLQHPRDRCGARRRTCQLPDLPDLDLRSPNPGTRGRDCGELASATLLHPVRLAQCRGGRSAPSGVGGGRERGRCRLRHGGDSGGNPEPCARRRSRGGANRALHRGAIPARGLASRQGVAVTQVDQTDIEAFAQAIGPKPPRLHRNADQPDHGVDRP